MHQARRMHAEVGLLCMQAFRVCALSLPLGQCRPHYRLQSARACGGRAAAGTCAADGRAANADTKCILITVTLYLKVQAPAAA